MKRLIAFLLASILGHLAPPALAVDTDTFKCEDKASAAVNKWGGARGKCLVKCQQAVVINGEARTCSNPPGFDAETAACVAAIDQKYVDTVGKACFAGTPNCGGYGGQTGSAYATNQIASLSAQIDPVTVPALMCDTDPEVTKTCESKVVGELGKLSAAIGKCLGKCYKALQVKGDAAKQCTPDTTGDPFDTLDADTSACVAGAIAKANAKITKACPILPGCGLYAGGLAALINLVTSSTGGSYADPASNPYCASASGAFLDPR